MLFMLEAVEEVLSVSPHHRTTETFAPAEQTTQLVDPYAATNLAVLQVSPFGILAADRSTVAKVKRSADGLRPNCRFELSPAVITTGFVDTLESVKET